VFDRQRRAERIGALARAPPTVCVGMNSTELSAMPFASTEVTVTFSRVSMREPALSHRCGIEQRQVVMDAPVSGTILA